MAASAEVVQKRDVQRPLLFECAWEVANKGMRCLKDLEEVRELKPSS